MSFFWVSFCLLLCSHESTSPFFRKVVQDQPSLCRGHGISCRLQPALQWVPCGSRGPQQAVPVETAGASHSPAPGAHRHQRGLRGDAEGGSVLALTGRGLKPLCGAVLAPSSSPDSPVTAASTCQTWLPLPPSPVLPRACSFFPSPWPPVVRPASGLPCRPPPRAPHIVHLLRPASCTELPLTHLRVDAPEPRARVLPSFPTTLLRTMSSHCVGGQGRLSEPALLRGAGSCCGAAASLLSACPHSLLQHCFMLPQSLGVIGGKPNSAHYFIGYVGECGPQWCQGAPPPALPPCRCGWSQGPHLGMPASRGSFPTWPPPARGPAGWILLWRV